MRAVYFCREQRRSMRVNVLERVVGGVGTRPNCTDRHVSLTESIALVERVCVCMCVHFFVSQIQHGGCCAPPAGSRPMNELSSE